MSELIKIKKRSKSKNKARIVERSVKSSKSMDIFKLILANTLPGQKSAENIMGTIVEAALVSEFSPGITQKKYYGKMVDYITSTMLKHKDLRQEAMTLAKGLTGLANKKIKVLK